MTKESYNIDNTQDLIRMARQTLGEVPVIDLTNWQSSRYTSSNSNIKSLAGSCHRVEVRTTIDGGMSKCPVLVDSSIVICTGPTIGNCPTDTTGACPPGSTINTDTYVNMIAVFTMGAAKTVDIIFKYVLNDVPTQTTISSYSAVAGLNNVYAFATNQLYPVGTSLILYGAEVV